jgi:hypothetical protein
MVKAQLSVFSDFSPTSFHFPVLPSAILERRPAFVNKKFLKNGFWSLVFGFW